MRLFGGNQRSTGSRGGRSAGARSGRSTSARVSRSARSRAGARSGAAASALAARAARFVLSPKFLLVGLVAWTLYEGVLSQHSVVNLYKFRQERNRLREELTQAEARRDALRQRLELIETDSFAQEKLARESLWLVKEGEILYRYEDPAPREGGEAPLMPPILDEGEHLEAEEGAAEEPPEGRDEEPLR